MITDRTFAVVHMAEECGVDAAADHYGLSRETVRRRMREVRSYERENTSCDSGDEDEGRIRDVVSDNKYLEMIEQRYTPAELKIIARGYLPKAKRTTPIHDFRNGDWVTIGVMSDLHLGSIYTNPDLVADVYEQFDLAKVDMVAIAGDVLEGMSQRPGHIYELSHLGYTTQVKHAVEVISAWTKTPIYMIDGNHDRWFIKSSGAYAVADICSKIPNAQFLGNDEGSIWLDKEKTVECRLWHGEDGSSYAISYRLQKLVESFSGGKKPNILFGGHVHKQGYFQIRNIQCFGAGCIQAQSAWMRSKRLSAETGFWVVRLKINNRGISRVQSEWFPFYL